MTISDVLWRWIEIRGVGFALAIVERPADRGPAWLRRRLQP